MAQDTVIIPPVRSDNAWSACVHSTHPYRCKCRMQASGATYRLVAVSSHSRSEPWWLQMHSSLFITHNLLICILPAGNWVEDRVHGQGEHIYANGNRYNGEWVDGKITGYGVLSFADGETYEGELKDGRMQGRGTVCSSLSLSLSFSHQPHRLVSLKQVCTRTHTRHRNCVAGNA